jgi:Na+/melibiose symporter-like transporter
MWGWRRLGLLLVGVPHQLACAVATYHIGEAANDAALMHLVWPAMFVLSAVLVTGLALWPTADRLFTAAGVVAAGALITWPLGVLGNYLVGFTRSGWSVVFASLAFVPYSALVLWWWITKVGPWQVRHEVGATVDGD